MRAERIENRRTRREKWMGTACFRQCNRPRDRQLASARVAPDRSPERRHGKLQTPAAAPDRDAGGKGGTSEFDLPGNAGIRVIDMERRAEEHHTIEVRERDAKRQGLAIGDIERSTADVRAVQLNSRGDERKVGREAATRPLDLPDSRRSFRNQDVQHRPPASLRLDRAEEFYRTEL
jgi:hypothetical protein